MNITDATIERLRGGVIVSCQARAGSPLYGPLFMAAFAQAAEMAGSVGIRANGFKDVEAVRRVVSIPIIGIDKQRSEHWPVYITPTVDAAREVLQAGADLVAIDATHRPRQGGLSPGELIGAIKRELGCLVMADIDSAEEGVAAAQAGADLVATTMAGYTAARPSTEGPDLDLVRELVTRVDVPVICEGRVRTPHEAAAALAAGAFAVVVGTAITNSIAITQSSARATARGAREINW